MKKYTEEEVLDLVVGEIGTPERDEFETQLKNEVDDYFIGEAIKQTRKKQGLTQEQLGERMGVQKAEVSKIESGKSITFATIVKAFRAFGRVALW